MAKNDRTSGSGSQVATGLKKRKRGVAPGSVPEVTASRSHRVVGKDRVVPVPKRAKTVEAVMRGAAAEGLTRVKDGRIAGRVSSELIAKAKARTGLQSDTELVEFALANVALDDHFAEVFREVKGTVDPDLDLSF